MVNRLNNNKTLRINIGQLNLSQSDELIIFFSNICCTSLMSVN